MSIRNVEKELFGVVGLGDPMSSFAQKTIRVAWDFAKTSVKQGSSAAKVVPLMPIPAGFCVDRISVVQTKGASKALALTFGVESDDSFTVGGTFTLVNDGELLRDSQAATTGSSMGKFFKDDDLLCMIVPTGTDTIDDGSFDVCVHGFETFAEAPSENKTGHVNYRRSLQTRENVGGGQFPLD